MRIPQFTVSSRLVLVVVAMLCVGTLILTIVLKGGESKVLPPSTPSTSGNPTGLTGGESEALVSALDKQIEGFCEAFFPRNYNPQKPLYTPTDVKENVAEFVTTEFMQANASTFGATSEDDVAMAVEHASLQVRFKSQEGGDEFYENPLAAVVDVRLIFTKFDSGRKIVTNFERSYRMVWTKDGTDVWRIWSIDDLPIID